jgi:hypothetical protein
VRATAPQETPGVSWANSPGAAQDRPHQTTPDGTQQNASAGREQAASELAAREPHQEDKADLLETTILVGGSSKPAMVELRGIEPLTSSMPWMRSTN